MKRDRSESPSTSVNTEKKQKNDNESQQIQNFSKDIRTAFDLNFALSAIRDKFRPIGKVVTAWPYYPAPKKKEQKILNGLSKVNEEANNLSQSYCYGQLEEPFYLKVTYPGCEYETKNLSDETSSNSVDYEIGVEDCEVKEETIQKWLKNAPVSGFGDNKALETRVDPEVREACEIPAEGFEVEKELLDTISWIWSDNFVPANVRVEPYKIHIYGKGGHFKSHRDTPEKSLVGTFLLGIGDSAFSYESSDRAILTGNFCIGTIRRTAKAGQWVAFHPDVPHSVEPLTHGCRAAIAFKIFSTDNVDILSEAAQRYPSVVEQAKGVLKDLKGPFGIILQHQYPMGTDENGLIGVDAVIMTAVKQVRSSKVEVIPVVVKIFEKKVFESGYGDERSSIEATVYPFTRHHVDICLNRVGENTHEAVAWIKDAKDLPFYSWNFKKNSMKWSSEEVEINHTGNESDGSRETSLYLAYAIVAM
ncbi:hypothetical protein L218DRAFT_961457 [Marasmius fiardii PR-910]|nr:hypothetical protein L218DRAFT_961457 [Marasmius fiardii PR-910]